MSGKSYRVVGHSLRKKDAMSLLWASPSIWTT